MGTGDREQAYARARQEAERLTANGIQGIALTWVDNAGLTRVKSVPTARLPQAARRGVGMSPVFDVYLVDDSMTTSRHVGGPDGDLRLLPDLERLTPLAAQPGWAWAPVDRYDQEGRAHPVCQRLFARRMAERARERGLAVRMGFETEWVVTTGDPDQDPPRYPTTGPAYGMVRLVDLADYLADLLGALDAQHTEVHQLHPEYSPGQFEVSLAPTDPVAAADLTVLVRETIRACSGRAGLNPMFGPVVDPGGVGNGAHLHLSLWQGDRNLCRDGDGPHAMTATAEAFLAGVLRELPALLTIGAPPPRATSGSNPPAGPGRTSAGVWRTARPRCASSPAHRTTRGPPTPRSSPSTRRPTPIWWRARSSPRASAGWTPGSPCRRPSPGTPRSRGASGGCPPRC